MDTRTLLERWRSEARAAEPLAHELWVDREPVPPAELARLEGLLGRVLPPSYREFLATTDGWPPTGRSRHGLRRATQVGWFATVDRPAFLQAQRAYAHMYPGVERSEVTLMSRALVISPVGEDTLLLDPEDVDPATGEWACWSVDWHTWAPVPVARSFRDALERRLLEHVALSGTRWALVDDAVEHLYRDLLAGELGARAALSELVDLDWRAALIAAQFDAFGTIDRPDHSLLVDGLWSGTVGGVSPDEAASNDVLVQELLPLYLQRLTESSGSVSDVVQQAPGPIADRLQALVDERDPMRGLVADFSYAPAFAAQMETAREQVRSGDLVGAWETVRQALPSWTPRNGDHLAPLGLYYDGTLRILLIPPPAPGEPAPELTRVLRLQHERQQAWLSGPLWAIPRAEAEPMDLKWHSARTLAVLQTPFRAATLPAAPEAVPVDEEVLAAEIPAGPAPSLLAPSDQPEPVLGAEWSAVAHLTTRELLQRWRSEAVGEAIASPGAWDGHRGPAGAEALRTLEDRLGTPLPPSYRQFLSVCDGWPATRGFIAGLAPTPAVGWFRDLEPDWVQIWLEMEPMVGRTLMVSKPGGDVLLLDPGDVDPESGEWACSRFWKEGPVPLGRSFRAGLEDLYRDFLSYGDPIPSVTLDQAADDVEQAYLAILAGDLTARDRLEEVLTTTWRAWLLAAQFDAFGAGSAVSDHSTSVNHLWWGIGDVSTDEALVDQVLIEDLLPLYVVRMVESGLNAEYQAGRAPRAVADEIRRLLAEIADGSGPAAVFSYAPEFSTQVEVARGQIAAGEPDAAWHTVRAALPTWRPMSSNHLAPLGLYYDKDLRRALAHPNRVDQQVHEPAVPSVPAGAAPRATPSVVPGDQLHPGRLLEVLRTPFRSPEA
ncbi:hypothetical protein GB931_05305 [Modestobacter sp. I12A-02628]|uniref:SMI1/KNR4 family protein n=1 Tax=Goekera deserti TaxID=2497753 RepID=A0A7K3WGS8_9ACTN|nr:SMI1/KNR4 family protein [Goekera deserti]MPQ97349.1 hypothetical protein [Goekera deserti]NDI50138.1 hypothetical protein [Goekera deserti]NEL55705.1 SMI1/KNR4 family protein [Goekera deserti]